MGSIVRANIRGRLHERLESEGLHLEALEMPVILIDGGVAEEVNDKPVLVIDIDNIEHSEKTETEEFDNIVSEVREIMK